MTPSSLGDWLDQLPDTELDDVLRDWRVPGEIATLEAAATWMQGPDATSAALAGTPAADLAALAQGKSTAALSARGLDRLPGIRVRQLPDADTVEPLDDDERIAAADRAVGRTVSLSGAVASIADAPLKMTARGIPLAAEQRARSAELSLEPPQWEALIAAARAAGLLARTSRALAVTEHGVRWLRSEAADRWLRLSELLVEGLTLSQRRLLELGAPLGTAAALPLADDAALREASRILEAAELLGLLQRGLPTGLTRDEVDARIPDPVDYVYLQPDLTIVAPGPLTHDVEQQLATMAKPESRGVASSWRLTPASVQRALALGESGDELLAALSTLSRTGVPQPVEYLVRDTERRFGSLIVQDHGGPDAARLTTDAETQRRLLVDRSLIDLGLRTPLASTGSDGVLVVDRPAADVVDRLIEARYPALLADAEGRPVVPARKIADAPEPQRISNLTARLRGVGVDISAMHLDWLTEQLTIAAKQKTPVRVTVVSGSTAHVATVVPLSVANGRLRGRDVEHDIERTLPLRAISEVAGLPS